MSYSCVPLCGYKVDVLYSYERHIDKCNVYKNYKEAISPDNEAKSKSYNTLNSFPIEPTEEDILNILRFKNIIEGIFLVIYYNIDKPNNHVLYIDKNDNMKTAQFCKVHINGVWTDIYINQIIELIITNCINKIRNYLIQNEDIMKIDRFMDYYQDDTYIDNETQRIPLLQFVRQLIGNNANVSIASMKKYNTAIELDKLCTQREGNDIKKLINNVDDNTKDDKSKDAIKIEENYLKYKTRRQTAIDQLAATDDVVHKMRTEYAKKHGKQKLKALERQIMNTWVDSDDEYYESDEEKKDKKKNSKKSSSKPKDKKKNTLVKDKLIKGMK
jgi:hypothetical protein